MANHGNQNKAKGKMKNPEKHLEDLENLLKDDVSSFDPKTGIMEAEGYRYNVNWEHWEEEMDNAESGGTSKPDSGQNKNVVACQNCGEDYSNTYRRCPFCDERPNRAKAKRGGAGEYEGAGMDPRHFFGFAISTVLIVSAGYIVVQEVLPFVVGEPDQSQSSSSGSQNVDTTPTSDDPTPPPENIGTAEPSTQDPAVQDPAVQEPPAEEPPVQDTVVEEPPVEEPPVEDRKSVV